MTLRGITSHFTASKASLARSNNGKDKAVSSGKGGRSTRSRLRTPDNEEVDKMIAENERHVQTSTSLIASSEVGPSYPSNVPLIGTPPPTPGRSSDLLDATQRSPISVRTDPDSGKMFLMMPKSTSPSKRKASTRSPHPSSPTKTPKTHLSPLSRRLISGEAETSPKELDDGLTLTPGRSKGTRIALGSPNKSPLFRSGENTRDAILRQKAALDEEQDENTFLTPRTVRQRPKGLPLPPLATQSAAAIFRSGYEPSAKPPPPTASTLEQSASRPTIAALSESEFTLKRPTQPDLPSPKHELSQDLPLPSYYSALVTLHTALEHALVVHLATAGCSSATLDLSNNQDSESDSETDGRASPSLRPHKTTRVKTVRLPNLITYSALRPLVERSGGRRLGPSELRRLVSVWLDFQNHASAQEQSSESLQAPAPERSTLSPEEVKGLGFIISKTRTMDARTGRKITDWGIGIELEIKRSPRQRTPPVQVGFGGLAPAASPTLPSAETFDPTLPGTPKAPLRYSTPPPSSSPSHPLRSPAIGHHSLSSPLNDRSARGFSTSHRSALSSPVTGSPGKKIRSSLSQTKAREGMSVVAMWNNGLEVRKAEVHRRLRERCARFHQLWLDSNGITIPTVSKKEEPSFSLGDPTAEPPSTPSLGDHEGSTGRTAVMGAGGLLTPSATRSGGRRVGKRTFALDKSDLERDALADSEDEEDADHFDSTKFSQPLLAQRSATLSGRQSLIEEADFAVRTSRSMPQLKSAVQTSELDVSNSMPPQGEMLRWWHPGFDLNDPKVVHPVPMVELPSLKESSVAPAGRFAGSLAGSNRILATPHRNKETLGLGIDNLSTPRKPIKFSNPSILDPPSTVPSTPTSSSRDATSGLSLKDRIKAKEELRKSQSMSAISHGSSMQGLSKRAMISRLPELSSIIFMLFSNGATLSSTGVTRSPTIAMSDLLLKLAKSLKIQLSTRECREAIDLLADIAPGFLHVFKAETGDQREFVKLGRTTDGHLWRLNEVRQMIAQSLQQ